MSVEHDQERARKSRRILDRVAREADSSTPSFVAASARRLRDHVGAVNESQADPVEYWARRKWASVGLIITIALLAWLVVFRSARRLTHHDGSGADPPRAVIVISSHVARGSVGNRAAVFALEMLGFPVWAVPTVMLPWHPGHGRSTRIVPPPEQFASFMKDLERSPWLGEVGGVLSGYLGDAQQAGAVASLVKAVRQRNPRPSMSAIGDGRQRRVSMSARRWPRGCAMNSSPSPTSRRPTASSWSG